MTDDDRARYEKRITYLQDQLEATARSGVENAARYAADIEAVRRAGAERVERIRLAFAMASDNKRVATMCLGAVDDSTASDGAREMAAAYLAQGKALAEARALLSDIGTRALALLSKAPT